MKHPLPALSAVLLLALAALAGGLCWSGRACARPEAVQAWTIGICTGQSPFSLATPAGRSNPVLTAAAVTDLEVNILAHPFLTVTDSLYYLFFTAKHDQTHAGGIGLATSRDGLDWQYRRIVLDEPFEISYPFVFQWQGQSYLVPESYVERSVRLYRATRFPDQWSLEAELITGEELVSPSLVHFQGRWWMFAGGLGNQSLRLFQAPELQGPWTEHPRSPIVANDPDIARPAGRPLVLDGVLYRLGQDCDPTYGNQVRAFRVTELSPTAYAEEPVEPPLVQRAATGWNSEAMHHVDLHRLGAGRWIAAVDALGR